MTYVASTQELDRKLRLARSAAASAVYTGCDPDEVRRVMEEGIAETLAERAASEARWAPDAKRPPVQPVAENSTGVLDAWSKAVGA